MTLSHTFSCTIADSTNTAIVRPANWNAAHVMAAGTALYGLVPVGGIMPWAGTIASLPAGYLICDGAGVDTTTYAGLFAAIGYAFGGAGATFNLPNLKDKFVVGAKQDDTVLKTNIRGSLEQSMAVTGATLTHSVTIADHTGLSHSGMAVDAHPNLSHVAIAVADHASYQFSGTIAAHATSAVGSAAAGNAVVTVGAHTVTWPSRPAVTHDVSVNLGSHASGNLGHTITQPAAHGAAGTLTHSFTPPVDHTSSIVPAFIAMPYIVRYQ